jgi:hypothetical protein
LVTEERVVRVTELIYELILNEGDGTMALMECDRFGIPAPVLAESCDPGCNEHTIVTFRADDSELHERLESAILQGNHKLFAGGWSRFA